ncbi:Sak2 [Ligilactobacillus pobuzihii E100301 = KCTC 13174]|uniref:Sak2 n=2 Tax=Ligilactobacillus pobuzihii TaxID=449659 RepID=A0A0R2LJK4_9LACO|nr:Sak2 [Ligilactobacillus pobuzihii E100301 = KCTC 13174]KRN99482.1 Sak2 [Ligilactobacillus pobuzihii]
MNIQSQLVAPKGQWNNFGNYAYRSAEDILNAVKPLLKENEATLTLTDEPLLVGDWHYIKATATFRAEDEEQIVTAYARESETKKGMDGSQITGTASSYARKYALNGLFLIDDTKDADSNGYHKQNNKPAPKKKNTAKPKIQMSSQEQNTVQNKGKLFKTFVGQIAETLGADQKDVQKGLVDQAKNTDEYKNGNSNQQATVLVRLAEAMKKQVQNDNKK